MSVASSHHYETIYILKPSISDSDLTAINQKIDNVISKFEGKLAGRDDIGNQQLAYMIDKNTNGRYQVIHYTGNRGVVEEIERHFKILDDVIRYITVAVPVDYDYQKLKRQIAAAEEEARKQREMRKARSFEGRSFEPREHREPRGGGDREGGGKSFEGRQS